MREKIIIGILALIIVGFLAYFFWLIPLEKKIRDYGIRVGISQIVQQIRQTGNVVITLSDGSEIILIEGFRQIDPTKLQGINQ